MLETVIKQEKILNHRYWLIIAISLLSVCGNAQTKKLSLSENGYIPVWLAAGPFEQPLVGFGTPADSDMIGEKSIKPFTGKEENDSLVKGSKTKWIVLSSGGNGFVDFNKSLRWFYPGKSPDKIWYALTGYAAAYIESPQEQKAVISYGSNSFGKIILNGKEVFHTQNPRNAVPDNDKIPVVLKKGENLLLVKVGNSHANHQLAFFDMIKWEWGFYLRLLNEDGEVLKNVSAVIPGTKKQPDIDIISTFFFKNIDGKLQQRFDIIANSPYTDIQKAEISLNVNGKEYRKQIDSVAFGNSRYEIFIPEIEKNIKASVSLKLGGISSKKDVMLYKQQHYELYMMMLSHMDIGYTHTQSVIKEMQAANLDDVITLCEKDPDFKWTIETFWQLEQFKLSRPAERYNKLISFIKEGRIAISPLYSNPFTGWTGEEELIRGLVPAEKLKKETGIEYKAAVYNDVPGQSWILPQLLKNAGVEFVAEGLNEIFNDYSFQRSLPKAFIWEGADGSRVVTYLNAAYNEGKHYGLEKRGNYAVQQRMWEKINSQKADGTDFKMILLNSSFGDNGTVPLDEYYSMLEWNKEYEYPKFISSNVSEFAERFVKEYKDSLKVIRGDWTSGWDINYQGEPDKMKKQRWVQHNLLSAEKILAVSSLKNPGLLPLNAQINDAYHSLLNFSGHGSGIEYGYASPEENFTALDFREKYVNDAYMDTRELLMRGMFRTGRPEETFEGEGVLVYNTLSWKRSAPVEVQFVEQAVQQYDVIDIETKEKVPSFRDGYKLYFVADSLPSLGYKKYRLQPVSTTVKQADTDLKISGSSIENKYYRIEYNSNGQIEKITDKKSSTVITDTQNKYTFGSPLIEKFQLKENYKEPEQPHAEVNIKDESPVRLIINIKRENSLFENISYTLWHGIDRIDMNYTINMNMLKKTEYLEDYGIAFPFAVKDQKELLEIEGGYLNPAKDKLPGSVKDAYSVRRCAVLYNNSQAITWSSADARVVKLRKTGNSNTLISNPVNNFPSGWNRNENNNQVIDFSYSFTSQKGSFTPSVSSRFGWEFSTPVLARRSWYKSDPPAVSYMNISNANIALLAMFKEDGVNNTVLRLMNFNNTDNEEAEISSELFTGTQAFYCNYLDEEKEPLEIKNNSIRVKLRPNEIATIKITNK